MADDDEYVEGNNDSAPADAPGTVPSDDAPGREAPTQGGFDSGSVTDAPTLQTKAQRQAQRNASGRKAFAEAILANRSAPAKPAPAGEAAELDPEAPVSNTPAAQIAATKQAGVDVPPPAIPAPTSPPVAAPPAPSLDPEIRQLREKLAAEREQLKTERSEWEKQRQAEQAKIVEPTEALSLEGYLDSSSRWFRTSLETMRGEKFATDDEFKQEASDFVTQISSDVLGVPLPENMKTALEAKLARKSVRTYKTIESKKAALATQKAEQERAAAVERAETERVEQEWNKAASALSQQFAPTKDVAGGLQQSATAAAHPWLAAEEEPGKIIVDVIRAAFTKDGTQLQWEEAAKRANDYLEAQAKSYYDKRKPLLEKPKQAAPPATAGQKPIPPVTPPASPPAAPTLKKWTPERARDSTRAAFRAAIASEKQ